MADCRVMQGMETGEEFCVFEGTLEQCWNWIEDNRDGFPESTWNVETITQPWELV